MLQRFDIVSDFVTKQLPHHVTWLLSLLYAISFSGISAWPDLPAPDPAAPTRRGGARSDGTERTDASSAALAHDLRYVASVRGAGQRCFGAALS